jgi:prophage antirepressor-like protein
MNNLVTIKNVRGFIDGNGTAQLHIEDTSRGLGFTRIAASGNEVVRWERVDGYLAEFGVPTCGHDGFIPENIFYRLAMKAKNEMAEKFQILIADEILPAIRKTGSYSVQPRTIEDLIILQAQSMKEIKSRVDTVETTVTNIKETIIDRDDNWRKWANENLRKIAQTMKATVRENIYQIAGRMSYEILEARAHCDLSVRLSNLRRRYELAGATKGKIDNLCKLDVIEADPKLKEIYTSIIKEMLVKYVA